MTAQIVVLDCWDWHVEISATIHNCPHGYIGVTTFRTWGVIWPRSSGIVLSNYKWRGSTRLQRVFMSGLGMAPRKNTLKWPSVSELPGRKYPRSEEQLPEWLQVRTALVALIAFMPTIPGGALGSLDYRKEERRKLAIKSREAAPKYGNAERQKLIDQIHEYMLSKAPPVPLLPPTSGGESQANPDSNAVPPPEDLPNPELEQRPAENVHEVRVDAAAGPLRVSFSAGVSVSRREAVQVGEQSQLIADRAQQPKSDHLFSVAALGLTLAIAVLLVKKFFKSQGIPAFMDDI